MAIPPMVAIPIGFLFWLAFALIGFFAASRINKENTQLIWIMFILTAICCFISWFCTYCAQLNPLIGPEIKASVVQFLRLKRAQTGKNW